MIECCGDNKSPRACSDSEEPRASALDSTPALQPLIAVGAGDAGSSPAREGSEGTPSVTAGAIPVAGAYADVFLVVFTEGRHSWQSGTVHATAEAASAFARGMKNYIADDDDGNGRDIFRFDSFEVVRYGRVSP